MPAQIIQHPNSRYARGFDAIDAVGALMLALAMLLIVAVAFF